MSHKILVADDDPFIRVFLQKQLTNAGYTVTIAENGAEGFAKAKADTPDIIVSDWTMPEMDGVEFCHAVRNDETLRYSYFILLTAKDDYEEKIKVMKEGADDYLTKPFNNTELLTRIHVGLRISDLQKELTKYQHRKALNEVALTMSHEINNPLGVIMLTLRSLQRKLGSLTTKEMEKDIESCLLYSKKIADTVKKLSELHDPEFKPYLNSMNTQLIDIKKSK